MGDDLLSIQVTTDGERATVRVSGELCPSSATTLLAVLDELRSGGIRHVELDLSELVLLTAAGVHVFLRCRHDLEVVGGTVHVHGDRGIVRRVLEVCRVREVLTRPPLGV